MLLNTLELPIDADRLRRSNASQVRLPIAENKLKFGDAAPSSRVIGRIGVDAKDIQSPLPPSWPTTSQRRQLPDEGLRRLQEKSNLAKLFRENNRRGDAGNSPVKVIPLPSDSGHPLSQPASHGNQPPRGPPSKKAEVEVESSEDRRNAATAASNEQQQQQADIASIYSQHFSYSSATASSPSRKSMTSQRSASPPPDAAVTDETPLLIGFHKQGISAEEGVLLQRRYQRPPLESAPQDLEPGEGSGRLTPSAELAAVQLPPRLTFSPQRPRYYSSRQGSTDAEDDAMAGVLHPLAPTGGATRRDGRWATRLTHQLAKATRFLGSWVRSEHSYDHARRSLKASKDLLLWPCQYIPAVILGLILNLLDAISYGLIAFPVSIPVYSKFGPDGLSMYLLSTAISQFVYSLGASAFRGANGCMMIEVIPFLHEMCFIIISVVGEADHKSIIATTMVAYALSAVLTGVVFWLMGVLRLGLLVDFFPRHILVGCIGGVGYFLLQTGLEVTSHVSLSPSLATLADLFEPNTFALWASSLVVALVLRALNAQIRHPLFVPVFFIVVPLLFYLVVWTMGIPLGSLRRTGWVFELPDTDVPFYHFYTQFDLGATNWHAVLKTVPTMIGLTFFGILHVPINVPALAVSTHMDTVDTNRELIAHGISNFIAGIFGVFQNYLVYSNSVLFIKSGGNSRLAGLMLGVATMAIFFSGPAVIGYIPNMVVGALIFHLGLELLKEALYDTWGIVSSIEYVTIAIIVLAMAILGFNKGIFLGILLACVFFIVIYSQRRPIRKLFTGSVARSTVRRVYRQRRFLEEAGHLIHVIRLQGFMFFGTINHVETTIRKLLDYRQWEHSPIQFLVLDFALVTGLDFSAAEAFIRIKRLLTSKEIHMVICGASLGSGVSIAMQNAGAWSKDDDKYVQTFSNLNEALEWCENILLKSYYMHKAAIYPHGDALIPGSSLGEPPLSHHYKPTGAQALEPGRLTPIRLPPQGEHSWHNQKQWQHSKSYVHLSSSPRQTLLHEATRAAINAEPTKIVSTKTSPTYRNQYTPEDKSNSSSAAGVQQASAPPTAPTFVAAATSIDRSPSCSGAGASLKHASNLSPPLPLLIQAFQDIMAEDMMEDLFYLVPYFTKKILPDNTYLWHQNDTSTALYLVESGLLRAFNESNALHMDRDVNSSQTKHRGHIDWGRDATSISASGASPTTAAARLPTSQLVAVESILPGTIIGELTLFTNRRQLYSIITEGQAVLWELSREAYEEFCRKNPAQALVFTRLALYYTAQSISSMTAHAFHL
ncbi:hypothetical protein EV182_000267 [Spiromyces aspiralis]|uniref:Uncharacterized protein n=1 Tax=Spiromyces aspiralis TaxID=68401 RepID=A0ACC1HKN2_9FUNG|nr:hypothetical protein EV182_000267 [Spiromyces aspiralis]